jgi:hypothetical protein
MTLAEDVATLQERLRAAERERVRAEGARDSAKAAYDAAREELKKQFGVETVEEATALLVQFKSELGSIVEDLSVKLDEIGV